MFVSKTKKSVTALGLGLTLMLAGATASAAVESESEWKIRPGNIPVTVTVTNIDPAAAGNDPVYVSIQTREEFRSLRGGGGIAPTAKTGAMSATFYVDGPGDYAVSVWHDRDGDARFSMSEDYTVVLDSYGASGNAPTDDMPTFDDVKFTVPNMGTDLTVEMINPS
ncbi:DUF2141 domain-containing protein [Litorimonas sp. WD9-15]|uniref:DUF2141 domain-containing protein n=1 Tax=Litorimonas sp. WD9-15 TaxID=3418716 RepID=UPI003D01F162